MANGCRIGSECVAAVASRSVRGGRTQCSSPPLTFRFECLTDHLTRHAGQRKERSGEAFERIFVGSRFVAQRPSANMPWSQSETYNATNHRAHDKLLAELWSSYRKALVCRSPMQ